MLSVFGCIVLASHLIIVCLLTPSLKASSSCETFLLFRSSLIFSAILYIIIPSGYIQKNAPRNVGCTEAFTFLSQYLVISTERIIIALLVTLKVVSLEFASRNWS